MLLQFGSMGQISHTQKDGHSQDATPDFPAYSYHVPLAINQPIARAMYWDMNRVRQKPWMPRFVIHEVHKLRY